MECLNSTHYSLNGKVVDPEYACSNLLCSSEVTIEISVGYHSTDNNEIRFVLSFA